MVSEKSKQYGISLIELMITIAILAILVTIGTSFTELWAKQAELDKASMSLKSAMGLAKATAIRNEFALNASQPTSQICLDEVTKHLTVHKASSTGSASCSSPIVLDFPLNSTLSIKNLDTTLFKCFAFNNFGQIVTEITTNCKTNLSLTISNGGLNETHTFN
jgi:prepilin-type N-terminal cleavage/methylation domain-containing protein